MILLHLVDMWSDLIQLPRLINTCDAQGYMYVCTINIISRLNDVSMLTIVSLLDSIARLSLPSSLHAFRLGFLSSFRHWNWEIISLNKSRFGDKVFAYFSYGNLFDTSCNEAFTQSEESCCWLSF